LNNERAGEDRSPRDAIVWRVAYINSIEISRGFRNPARVEQILRALPGWFGVESAVLDYVEEANTLPSYAAEHNDEVIGICLVKRHTPHAAEIYLMAVEPGWQRKGVGTALLRAAEGDLVSDGIELLQVKTLGPSDPDPHYELTRRFYEASGFTALEEIEGLWPGNPCLILVKHLPSGRR
jgi:ribosomal protein S18 acetylase RimI-like enzyme